MLRQSVFMPRQSLVKTKSFYVTTKYFYVTTKYFYVAIGLAKVKRNYVATEFSLGWGFMSR